MSTRRRPPRRLSDEERALWLKVAETVSPIKAERRLAVKPKPQPKAPSEPVAAAEAAAPPPKPRRRAVIRPSGPAPTVPVTVSLAKPHLAPVERKTERKLARGAVDIDARLDLHGLRQDAAHRALRSFIVGAQSRGARIVLVITGKGRTGEGEDAGVLRRAVPRWLEAPDLRPLVVGVSVAHRSHGGDGALYVQVRRK
jgi:DNA-nicking Smr family endonuclease